MRKRKGGNDLKLWIGFGSNEPSLEGVIELRGPLLVPITLDSLLSHHGAVDICNKQIYHKEHNRRMAPEAKHRHPRSDQNGEIAAPWCQREIYTKRFQRETLKNWIKITFTFSIVLKQSPQITKIYNVFKKNFMSRCYNLNNLIIRQIRQWIYEISTNTHQATLRWTRHPTEREEEAVWPTSQTKNGCFQLWSSSTLTSGCQQPRDSQLCFLPTETERTRSSKYLMKPHSAPDTRKTRHSNKLKRVSN